LAVPALEVGVPTPITVHLDKCQQCANDLEAIRQLNLTHKQLCRLSQLFADQLAEGPVSCSQAQTAISPVVAMTLSKIDAEVLKHLCICSNCREQLYRCRETVRAELPPNETAGGKFPCEEASATDLFDYCLPYGIDPAHNQYAKFRPAFTSHAATCPTCLAKMQQLHSTVSTIAERPDSEVVTHFTVEEQINRGVKCESDDLYADWPIKVEVLDKSKLEHETFHIPAGFPDVLKQKVLALNLKQYVKPAAAAAAILIVGLLVFYGPVAKGVDLGQVYKALKQVKNLHFTTFDIEEPEPIQEVWVSRALNIKMSKTKTESVLWDARNKSRKSKDFGTGSIKIASVDNDVLAKVEETMKAPWGLLPFEDISKVPPGANWRPVADEDIETIIPHTEVYDLTWVEKELGSTVVYEKWRGYIDIETKLPKRIERWEKRAEEYRLLTVTKVAYLTAVEISHVINDAGF